MKTTDRQGRPAVQEHDPGPRARGRLDQLLLIDNVPSLDQDRHSAHRRNPPGTVSGGCRPLALGPPHRNLVSGFWTGSAATSARRWSGPGPAWQASGVKKCHGVETDHGRQRRETSEKPKVNEDRHVTCRETPHPAAWVAHTTFVVRRTVSGLSRCGRLSVRVLVIWRVSVVMASCPSDGDIA
jgi:hypothetical protein